MNISPEYFNMLNHLAVFADTQRSFILSHRSKDAGNFCKWEQSLNVTQSIIGLWSGSHTNCNDAIMNNNNQPVYGKEKSADILATSMPCSFYKKTDTDRRKRRYSTGSKLTPHKIIKVEHWSGIWEQGGVLFSTFFLNTKPCFLGTSRPSTTTAYQMEAESSSVWLLCCKLATWFSMQCFTFTGAQWITPEPCQNNWNANQIPWGWLWSPGTR